MPAGSFRYPAVVTGILPTGGSWIIEVNCEGRVVFLTTTESPALRGGEEVWLHARPTSLHVFGQDRQRLAGADEALARAAAGMAAVRQA